MDDDQIPLSAIQHWAYCPRQWGLIHLEQAFDENVHTLRGQALHKHVDDPGSERQKAVRIERALPLWHDQLGLVGKADVVEFLVDGTPYPIEYKQGSRHKAADIARCDELQLTAQCLCLEAMTGKSITEGAIYYASSRRRKSIAIDESLRAEVLAIATSIRQAMTTGSLPRGYENPRCKHCSLHDRCQPSSPASQAVITGALSKLFDPDIDL